MSTSPLFLDSIVVNTLPGQSFLDVGAGHGKWGYLLKKCRWMDHPRVTAVDIFEPHVLALKREGIYDQVHQASALHLPFADKSFDSAIACEIIEHLPAGDGPQLIAELQRVCRMSFVITTPNFSCLRGGGETLDGFNEHEAHLHNYDYRSFSQLGFTQIIGTGVLKIRPYRAAIALSSIGYYWPRWSQFLAGYWFADGRQRNIILE
jgi:SAM-dependent methyltransferase